MRGETAKLNNMIIDARISIHSPHARGAPHGEAGIPYRSDFNPFPSHKGRHSAANAGDYGAAFQPTPLMRGETSMWYNVTGKRIISIHSPHARGDTTITPAMPCFTRFQSTPLTRGETGVRRGRLGERGISIRSPHARGDSISLQKSIRIYVSLHNKTMIHRFSGLYKPLFAAQSPIFGVRSPRESHDSFTFARPSDGRGITP